jgi:Family of unknown function (DUF5652)
MNPFSSFLYPFPPNITLILLLVLVWSLAWKGYALWMAVKRNQKGWFIALLIFNTAGILEIFYIFYVVKKKWAEVEKDLSKLFS